MYHAAEPASIHNPALTSPPSQQAAPQHFPTTADDECFEDCFEDFSEPSDTDPEEEEEAEEGEAPPPSDRHATGDDQQPPSEPDSDHDEEAAPPRLPVAKRAGLRMPLIGDAVRRNTQDDEEHLTVQRLASTCGVPVNKLPVPEQADAGDGHPVRRTTGCIAGKLEQIPDVCGNNAPPPCGSRQPEQHRAGEDWATAGTYIPHPRATAPKEIRQSMVMERIQGRAPDAAADNADSGADILGTTAAESAANTALGAEYQEEGGDAGGETEQAAEEGGQGQESGGAAAKKQKYEQSSGWRDWKRRAKLAMTVLAAVYCMAIRDSSIAKFDRLLVELHELTTFKQGVDNSTYAPAEGMFEYCCTVQQPHAHNITPVTNACSCGGGTGILL